MSTLTSEHRRQLGRAVLDAREVAEIGARKALEELAVHEADPYTHLDEEQRALRRRLRAQARQLGDKESGTKKGTYAIDHLVEKVAYDQWHRLLFARFLLENNLLNSPDHGVAVSLSECEELAPELGLRDGWAVAARFAAVDLPQIFRADDPAGQLTLPVEDRNQLIKLVNDVPREVFLADDSLGWTYQYWQEKKKDEVNASGKKIGADELPAVTQLFTEDYMVDFLLHNTIGAWWAGKQGPVSAGSEEEARAAVSLSARDGLPAVEWKFLRFIQDEETGAWKPAAGTFDGWPKAAKDITYLDPCMGSGHFPVFVLPILARLRMEEEDLDATAAVHAVLRDNLHGLELDMRCTQIAAFNVALTAWKLAGYQALPEMHLACCGLAPQAKLADWLELAGDNEKLRNGMERLYKLFEQAPVLGSLINPRLGVGDLVEAGFHELLPVLEKALAQETANPQSAIRSPQSTEMAVTARGLAKAAEILAGQFTLVATNVPYLLRRKQSESLYAFLEMHYPHTKHDLATAMVERCLAFGGHLATCALVTPNNWLFLKVYSKMRKEILAECRLNMLGVLGSGAFETISGDVVSVVLACITSGPPEANHLIPTLDASDTRTTETKRNVLEQGQCKVSAQSDQLQNPDSAITVEPIGSRDLLAEYASAYAGLRSGDTDRFTFSFWELQGIGGGWVPAQGSFSQLGLFTGCDRTLRWEDGKGALAKYQKLLAETRYASGGWKQGWQAWGKAGILISQMGELKSCLSCGTHFEIGSAVMIPKTPEYLPAIWAFCSTADYFDAVRKVNPSLFVTNASLVNVPFDLAHWQKVAAEKYPHGLPKPFSSDPTQWLFSGHPNVATPAGAGLQVAVARLLGYRWPRQTGSEFPDCPALGKDGLEKFADDDGIVCISPIKGEEAAAERLRALLAAAYSNEWSAAKQAELLAQVDYAGKTLEDWLRNGFFEQHCKLFHHRPFIWHIWDGHKSGFSALVNYHQLDRSNLEKLTYTYLGDWIRRQQAAVDAGEAGSDARLQAANELQNELKKILEGEPPYDIFVRWKPLKQQPIGWDPDLNDGVRVNIRPFLLAKDVGKKGAGILRSKPNIKWGKDRGTEPHRPRDEYPWFWGWDEKTEDFKGRGDKPDGNRWNDCHYSIDFKRAARGMKSKRRT